MTTIHAQVPDALAKKVAELALQEQVTVDQLVSIALASQVSAWRRRDTIAERAKRGSWENFDRVTDTSVNNFRRESQRDSGTKPQSRPEGFSACAIP